MQGLLFVLGRRGVIGLVLTVMTLGAFAAVATAQLINLPIDEGTPPPENPGVTELAPEDEGFSCRASSARVTTDPNDPTAPRLEPFVANRDEDPCVDDDAGVPSLTQIPSDATPTDPRAIVGGAFARTRDGDLAGDPEAPPPPEEENVVSSEAGAATVFLTDGEQVLAATGVRSEASVTCFAEDGTPLAEPRFESSSSLVTAVLGDPASPIVVQGDDPETPDIDESHIHLPPGEPYNGPIHLNHEEFQKVGDRTILIRRALWLENGDPPEGNGSEGEIVVGESIVDVTGNPCTGRINVAKNRVPNSPQDFTFTGLPGAADQFQLDDDGVNGTDAPTAGDDQLPRSRSFDVVPGQHTVTESDPGGNFLREAECVGDDAPVSGTGSATVDLQSDEEITCTFLNIDRTTVCPGPNQVLNDQGQCVITVVVCPPGTTGPNAQGQCVVNQVLCPPGSSGPDAQNQCVRNETVCPPGSTFNAQGQCVVTQTQCPSGSAQNAQGQCVVSDVQCPAGSVRNQAGQCVSTQVVQEDVPRGGVVVPIDQVPGAGVSPCSRPGFGELVGIIGTNGPDRITGTNRSDRIFSFGGSDRVSGGRGNDCVEGGSGNDNLDGSNGADFLLGGTGRDILNGGTGLDTLEGGAGIDKLTGGSGNDRMSGGDSRDKLSGGLGNDRLNGGGGRDFIEGGTGRDTVKGGSGPDAINVAESGPRRDIVDCGPGRDVVRIDGTDKVRNCERVLVLRKPRGT